jgi:hypothetical protein
MSLSCISYIIPQTLVLVVPYILPQTLVLVVPYILPQTLVLVVPYMAEKTMCLQADQLHVLNAFFSVVLGVPYL